MRETKFKDIFKKGSKTHYVSSLFFPKDFQEKLSKLYAFARVVDDFVDQLPQKKDEYRQFKQNYLSTRKGIMSGNDIIDDFYKVQQEVGIKDEWVDSFLASMEMDLNKKKYLLLDDTLSYTYGSAEVIGLWIVQSMNLPKEVYKYARMMGRTYQYLNFIRDIKEDLELNRSYFPKTDFEEFGVNIFDHVTAMKNPEKFRNFMRMQLSRFDEWNKEAKEGYHYVPKKYRVAIWTACDMYDWAANRISKNPFIVFEKKVKPSKFRILLSMFKNTFKTYIFNH